MAADWRDCRVVRQEDAGLFFRTDDSLVPGRIWRDQSGAIWVERELCDLLPLVPVLDADGQPVVRTVGDLTARHIGKRVRVEGLHVVTEGTLRLLPYMDSFDMWWLKVGASIHVPGLDTPCEVLS